MFASCGSRVRVGRPAWIASWHSLQTIKVLRLLDAMTCFQDGASVRPSIFRSASFRMWWTWTRSLEPQSSHSSAMNSLDQLIAVDDAILVEELVFDPSERLGLEGLTAERRYQRRLAGSLDDHLEALDHTVLVDGFRGVPLGHLRDGGLVLRREGLEERIPHRPMQAVEPVAVVGVRIVLRVASVLLAVHANDREITVVDEFGAVGRLAPAVYRATFSSITWGGILSVIVPVAWSAGVIDTLRSS